MATRDIHNCDLLGDRSMDTNIGLICAMGYSHDIAVQALEANQNDVTLAIDWIEAQQRANSANNDGEFDLLGAAPPAPAMSAPTVFHPRTGGHAGVDHFATGTTEGSVAEMVDARISTFTEMGFTHEQAVAALRQAKNDVNDALTLLLNGEVQDL
jgi:uncharacterized UBP type Zn finger protein